MMNAVAMTFSLRIIMGRRKTQSIEGIVETYVIYTWIPLTGVLYHLSWFKEAQMRNLVAQFERAASQVQRMSPTVSPIPLYKVAIKHHVVYVS